MTAQPRFLLARSSGLPDEAFLTLAELARRLEALRGRGFTLLARPCGCLARRLSPSGPCVAVDRLWPTGLRHDVLGFVFGLDAAANGPDVLQAAIDAALIDAFREAA